MSAVLVTPAEAGAQPERESDSIERRKSWIASAASVSPATIILRPLYSGGLWLPVTITPLPVAKWWVAK